MCSRTKIYRKNVYKENYNSACGLIRIGCINAPHSLYEKYIEQFVNNDSDNADDEYLTILTTVLTIRDYFDKNMVELIKQLVRMKAVRK